MKLCIILENDLTLRTLQQMLESAQTMTSFLSVQPTFPNIYMSRILHLNRNTDINITGKKSLELN